MSIKGNLLLILTVSISLLQESDGSIGKKQHVVDDAAELRWQSEEIEERARRLRVQGGSGVAVGCGHCVDKAGPSGLLQVEDRLW